MSDNKFMKIRYDLLDPNPYSRPQYRIDKIKGLVVHFVANPMSLDYENRNFFNNRQYGKDRYGSAHEIIGFDNTVLVCIPDDEMAYHVGASSYMDGIFKRLGTTYPNDCLYGIEFVHPDWTGKPSDVTYKTLIYRLADLCAKYNLDPIEDIYRHYDITGKNCPKYYVENPDEFDKMREEVKDIMSNFDNHPIYDKWQLEQGSDSIDNLVELGMLDTPDLHKETLTKGSIPPWIAYSLFSRLTTMLSEKQSDTNVDYNKVALEIIKMLDVDLNIK